MTISLNRCNITHMSDDPKHKTIKVWFSTYRTLRQLAAEKPESMAALIDRLVNTEKERRKNEAKKP